MEENKKLSNFDIMAKARIKKIKLIVAGSRDIEDYGIVAQCIRNFMADYAPKRLVIIEGGARGVDKLAKRFAIENKIDWKEYRADWNKHGKAAGPIRNKKMAKKGTHLLAIWDGESRGTEDMVEQAIENNLTVRLITYKTEDL